MQEVWSGLGGERTSAAATLWPLLLPQQQRSRQGSPLQPLPAPEQRPQDLRGLPSPTLLDPTGLPCSSLLLPALAQSYALFNCQSADAKMDLAAA